MQRLGDGDELGLTGMDLIRSRPGLLAKIAAEIGITRAAVAMWSHVPLNRVPEVAEITGFSRKSLRPDFPWDCCEGEIVEQNQGAK